MLLISRRKDEKIVMSINNRVVAELVVSKIVGNQVWIGFDAPKSTVINRKEIHAKILAEGK
jgi:carbon storage regulator CsrA